MVPNEPVVDDALAVLDAHRIDAAVVVAACAGVAIGLELLTQAPDRVSRLLAHEPLLTSLLPNTEKARHYEGYLEIYRQHGPAHAMGRFLTEHDLPYPEAFRRTASRDGDHWLENELLPLMTYRPDIAALRAHHARIVPLAGEVSVARDLSFARITAMLARQLDIPVTVVPGTHSAYHGEPEAFARALIPLLTAQ